MSSIKQLIETPLAELDGFRDWFAGACDDDRFLDDATWKRLADAGATLNDLVDWSKYGEPTVHWDRLDALEAVRSLIVAWRRDGRGPWTILEPRPEILAGVAERAGNERLQYVADECVADLGVGYEVRVSAGGVTAFASRLIPAPVAA